MKSVIFLASFNQSNEPDFCVTGKKYQRDRVRSCLTSRSEDYLKANYAFIEKIFEKL